MGSPLLEKSKVFALEVIKVCNFICSSKRESVLIKTDCTTGIPCGHHASVPLAFFGSLNRQSSIEGCRFWKKVIVNSNAAGCGRADVGIGPYGCASSCLI